jgi:hypothetical protein
LLALVPNIAYNLITWCKQSSLLALVDAHHCCWCQIDHRLQTFYTVKVSKVPSQTTIPRISPHLVIMTEMTQWIAFWGWILCSTN